MDNLNGILKETKNVVKKHIRKTLAFDFDGVIHLGYDGWKDGSIYGRINEPLVEQMERLLSDYNIIIMSSRDPKQIVEYMNNHPISELYGHNFRVFHPNKDNLFWNDSYKIGVTNYKVPASLYIDDRALNFDSSLPISYNIDLILTSLITLDK